MHADILMVAEGNIGGCVPIFEIGSSAENMLQLFHIRFRYEACELGLKELLSRFVGSRHVGRVHAERLQAALLRLPVSDAIHYAKTFIAGKISINSITIKIKSLI